MRSSYTIGWMIDSEFSRGTVCTTQGHGVSTAGLTAKGNENDRKEPF